MIRHYKSLIISLIIHIILLFTVLYTWENYFSAKNVECSSMKNCDRLCVSLCNVGAYKKSEKKEIKQVKKSEVKKELVNKTVPVKKEIKRLKREDITQKETIKEKKIVEEVVEKEKVIKDIVPQETQAQKDAERKIKQESLEREYLQINTQKIVQLLQDNLYYPRSARKRQITGEITVKFTLGLNSEVYDISVVKSNSDILSRAAIKTIENLSGEFPRPTQKITLKVPIGYQLR